MRTRLLALLAVFCFTACTSGTFVCYDSSGDVERYWYLREAHAPDDLGGAWNVRGTDKLVDHVGRCRLFKDQFLRPEQMLRWDEAWNEPQPAETVTITKTDTVVVERGPQGSRLESAAATALLVVVAAIGAIGVIRAIKK